MKVCPFCFRKVEQIDCDGTLHIIEEGRVILTDHRHRCNHCKITLAEEDLQEIKIVRFFCPKCGEEMWQGVPRKNIWDEVRELSFRSLQYQAECSDCRWAETKERKENVTVSQAQSITKTDSREI